MKKFALVALLALFACSTTPTDATAAFQVTIKVGANTPLVVVDNDTPMGDVADGSSVLKRITVLRDIDGYSFDLTITTTSPSAGLFAVNTQFAITRNKTSPADDIVSIVVTSPGFNIPATSTPINLQNLFANSQALFATGGEADSFSTVTAAPNIVTPTAIMSINNTSTSTSTSGLIGPTPFSVNQNLVFNNLQTVSSGLSISGSLTTNVTVVPVPPALALLASGALPLAGFYFLRRRKQA
jgi:hypothetical protein